MNLKRLSIGTFNLLNLNEPGLPIYTNQAGWSQDQYERKIDWTQRMICLLHPDVFGFQELWHAASIQRAIDASGLAAEYDLLAPQDADGTHIVCAAMVRKGLLAGQPEWIVRFPSDFVLKSSGDDPQTPAINVTIDSFSRPVLRFALRPREDHEPVQVYVCHFKSKGPTQVSREAWFQANRDKYQKHAKGIGSAISTIRRTAEAAALRFILSEQMKQTQTPVIVIGDINDGQHSNTANILTEQPKFLVGDSMGGGDLSLYTAQTLQEYRDFARCLLYAHSPGRHGIPGPHPCQRRIL